jgi:ketosteroid isomerase-like protein
MQFEGMSRDEARRFAADWLPAWTGNRPELLASFYADDAVLADPAIPDGIRGREAILGYFKKLLARYPDWVWTQRDSIPMQDGFLNLWHADIPVGGEVISVDGVCTVELKDGKIVRNETYFDRSALLAAVERCRRNG